MDFFELIRVDPLYPLNPRSKKSHSNLADGENEQITVTIYV